MADKVLTVDVNVTSKDLGDVLGKAQAGTLSDKERRTFFSNLNNTLIQLKKVLEQLQKTMAQQQKATGAPAAVKGTGAQKEDKARKEAAKQVDKFKDDIKKSGSWIQKETKKSGEEIKKSGKKAAKDIEEAGKKQAEAVDKGAEQQKKNVKKMEQAAAEMEKTGKKLTEAGKTANNLIAESKKLLVQPYKVPKIDQRMNEIDKMMSRFSGSLTNLIDFIEKQARATARKSRGRLEVLGEPGRGFQLSERELKLEIVDVKALIKEIKNVSDRIGETFEKRPGVKAEDLFGELRSRIARELRLELPGYEKQAQEIAKIMSKEMGKVVKAAELMKDKTEQQLEGLFDEKVIQAEFNKLRRELTKTLSLPRIQATPERGPYIEGRTGSQKGIIRFAEFESGMDRIFRAVEGSLGSVAKAQDKNVKEVRKEFKELKLAIAQETTQPGGARAAELSKLVVTLLNMAEQAGGPAEKLAQAGTARAIATGEARRAGGVSGAAFEKRRRELEKLPVAELAKQFYKFSDDLNITTKDIIQSLDKLDFQNIYDRILNNLKQEDQRGRSTMKRFFQNLEAGYTSALRDFEKGIGAVTDLLPQVAANLPKAGVAARETTAVITAPPKVVREGQYGPYLEERAQKRYQPEFTQREIIELNQRLKSYFSDLAVTGRLIDKEVQSLSTLGVSESVGATIDQLEGLNKVLFKMSSLDLTKLTPFGEQFANAARAMSQTMRALSGPQAQFPKLQTQTEQGFIKRGEFGQQGFGYNVVTELRHTADTFEDQVEISGKLTKVMTETVRKIVVPAGTVPESLTAEKIDKVGNEIIKLLGARQEVKFSADETFVKDIRQASTVVTGQDVDVQIIQIIERFFAQWGRKITTRGSTKGLSAFPADPQLSLFGEAAKGGAKLQPAETLGVAKLPKTMGELAVEMLEKQFGATDDVFKKRLIEAGNKFFIDIFSGAKSALGETQGKELKALLEDLNAELGTSFTASVAGVKRFQKSYMDSLGDAANLFKEVPIEARISLRGTAKRGVQSDLLESFANNLTGGVETVLPDKVDIEKWLGSKGVFERYLEALGFIKEANEQIAAYSEVIEKGGVRQGFVGEKFLQITEEPHLKAPWQEEDVERGTKGLRLNLQAFSALSGIFGQQSEYLNEISMASRSASEEARELITSMSLMGSKFDDLKPQLQALLQTVDVGDVKVFEKASGSFEEMQGTILDLQKYAQSFILAFPEAAGGGALLVPGGAARKTYPEELTGGRGPIGLARKLDLVVDAAHKALEIATGTGRGGQELFSSDEVIRNFENALDKQVNILTEFTKEGRRVDEKAVQKAFSELLKFLQGGERAPTVPAIFTPHKARGRDKGLPLTEVETVRRSLGHRLGVKGGLEEIAGTAFKDLPRKAKTIANIYADIGRQIRDIVVGSETWGEEVEVTTKLLARMKETGETIMTPELLAGLVPDPENFVEALQKRKKDWGIFAKEQSDIGFLQSNLEKQTERAEYIPKVQRFLESQEEDAEKTLRDFAANTKVEVEKFSKEALDRAVQRLAGARTRYSEELGRSLLGKGGAVDVGLFQKQVPAARGQVVNLKVDKIPELEAALAKLEALDAGTGELSENIVGLKTVIEEQKKLRKEAAAEGRPFVREGEVLLPPEKAKLLGEQAAKALEEGMQLFVETVRFPVTGAPSFQPAQARLMGPEMAGFSPTAIGLPGRAPLDIDAVSRFIEPLNDQINKTRMELDGLDASVKDGKLTEDDAKARRMELVSELQSLKDIVSSTTTKFAPFEQNLDFDGDAIFVHAAATKGAAEEIRKHYESLRGMDKDIFAVRQAIFNVINAIQEKDIAKIADVAGIFGKQFPEEKGFGFLKRPGPRFAEDLTKDEILKAIESYLGEDTGKIVAEKIGKGVSEATEEELRIYLTDLKLAEDIVKLVGHKIGIGQVTETMNRMARAAEVIVGMGGGIAGGGTPPTGGFLERWKPGLALGEDPAREFQFRLNEMLRFGINAAFKTKHGGGSIYEELTSLLSTESGGARLRKEFESGKGPFAELAEINAEIQASIKDRLRQFSFEEIKEEGRRLGVSARGKRETIINRIVEKIDLPGFVEELHTVLFEAAVEAEKVVLTKEMLTQGFELRGTDFGERARLNVEEKLAERGGALNIREDITDILQPLYQLRTSAADVDNIFRQFGDTYEQEIPQWAQVTKEITDRMTKVKVFSDHLSQSMRDTASGLTASGDAVTAMMQSYAKQLLDIIRIQKAFAKEFQLATQPGGAEPDFSKRLGKLLAARGLDKETVEPGDIPRLMSAELEKLGIADIPKELKESIRESVTERALEAGTRGEDISKEMVDFMMAWEVAVEQLKRIASEIGTLSFREAVVRETIPGLEAFAGTPAGAPRGRRGGKYFTEDIPGGPPPFDADELRKKMEAEIGKATAEPSKVLDTVKDHWRNNVNKFRAFVDELVGAEAKHKIEDTFGGMRKFLEDIESFSRDMPEELWKIQNVIGEEEGRKLLEAAQKFVFQGQGAQEPLEKVEGGWKALMDETKKAAETMTTGLKETTQKVTSTKMDMAEEFAEEQKDFDKMQAEESAKLRRSVFDPKTGAMYDPEEVDLPPDVRKRVHQAISDNFKFVGEKTAEEFEKGAEETRTAAEEAIRQGSAAYTSKVKSAAQAAGGSFGAGGGDDGGDDDDFLKKLNELREQMTAALSIKGADKKIERLQEIIKALKELQSFIEVKDPTSKILASINEAIIEADVLKKFADPEAIKKIAEEVGKIDDAQIPVDDIIANLRELQNLAEQTHKLYLDVWQAPEFLKDIIEKIQQKGARGQFVEEFRTALQDANITGVAETEAWKRYHLAKVEYHLRSAEQFRQMAIEADSLAKTGEFARRAASAAGQAQKSVVASYRGQSPYLTSQPRAPGGVRGRPLDPALAEAAGVTIDPRILQAQIAEYANLRGELEPLLDMLTEIELEGLTGPLQKARTLFAELSGTVEQAGAQWQEAFDLSTFTQDLTTLRGALEEFLFRNINASEVQRQNLRDTLFYLKDLEKQYARLGDEVVKGGILKVPKWLQPDVQRELHKRNLDRLREGFGETVSGEGKGPKAFEKVGERLNYTWKVFDEGGNVVDNFVFKFKKLGDAWTSQGKAIGRFTESVDDMNKAFQTRQGISSAFRRVLLWGGAAAIVYGTVQALQDMVDTISGVETAMVQLRKVMNPVITDFEEIQMAGVEMAKNFGVPIENIIESMRVFAQQGLKQADVLDRARTSTLAANVTVLSAQDATEALTSATKQFSDEIGGSISFLDSWIEVAARHAITSKDLALAMQRAGSAAKNAGVDFNELNALVTGIGVTTRQTGREIGTSIRFIARRLTAAKAPAELAKVGIQAFAPTGEVRRAFDIFDELAMRWDGLTQAQRLNISMAVGGRRHYNSVLVLMKNWDETLEALTHSQNSQGSAMRRNLIVMDTFNKKIEQLRQSVIETQLAFGKFALPVAKGLIDSVRFIVERVSEIPDSIKIATLALGGMLVLASKGAGVIDRMADSWSTLTGFGKIGIGGGAQKGITSLAGAVKGITAAKSIYDVNSALGKLAFILVDVGRSYNAFIGNAAGSIAIFNILKVATVGLITAFTGIGGPLAAFSKFTSAFTIPAFASLSLIMKSLSETGTGLIGSLGPLALTLAGLYNVTKPLIMGFIDANKTAKEFAEERQNEVLQIQENINVINELAFSINKMDKAQQDFVKGTANISSATFAKNIEKMRRNIGDLAAKQMPSAIEKFDEFGHAVLKGSDTLFRLAAGIKDVNESALEIELGEQLARFNKELTTTKEGIEKTKFALRELVKDVPIFGDTIAKTINVAPIIDLQEHIRKTNMLLSERASFPLTAAFEELYQESRENMMKTRAAVEESVAGMQKTFSKLPRGATVEEYVRTITKYREELETLAGFKGRELQTDIGPGEIVAVKAFARAGTQIEELGELTYDAFIKAGKVAKRALSEVQADFKKEGKSFEEAVALGLDPAQWEFRSGDIILFAKEYADQFGISSGHALFDIRETADGMGQAVISFIDDATLQWTTIDFSDRIQQLVMSVFSPSGFKEAVTEGVDAASKILAGAAAGIKYPTPIDLGERFFSQVGTPEQLATTFGFKFDQPIGQTEFGRPEFKETFELDYRRLRKSLSDYQKDVETVNKISQDGKIIEAELAKTLSDRMLHLQRVITNETAIANFRAVVIDLGKSFEEANRSLKTAIQNEKLRSELLRRPAGLFTGLPRDIPSLPETTATLGDAAVEDIAYATSSRFRELTEAYSEQNLTMDALLKRVQDLNKAQEDLRYLEDLYKANEALVAEIDFDKFTKELAITGDKNAARTITELTGIKDGVGDLTDVQREILRIQKGEGKQKEDFTPIEAMEEALSEAGGFVGAATAGSLARGEGAFGDVLTDMDISAGETKRAAELFNYAADKLGSIPFAELLREYKNALAEVNIAPGGAQTGLLQATLPGQFKGTAITRLFTAGLEKNLGEQAFGDKFLKLTERIEKERRKEGPQFREDLIPEEFFLPFEEQLKQQQVTVDQLRKLFAVDVRAAANTDKLITQLSIFLAAIATKKGSQIAGAALGFGPGARIGEALGIGRIKGGLAGSFLGTQLADIGEDQAEARDRIAKALEKDRDIITAALSPGGPEDPTAQSILNENQQQTDYLKIIAEEIAKVPDPIDDTYELLQKNRDIYGARQDIGSILRSGAATVGVGILAGLAGGPVERAAVGTRTRELATDQFEKSMLFLLDNIEIIERLAPDISTDMDAAVKKMRAALKEPVKTTESEIRNAFDVLEQMFELLGEETGKSREEIFQLFKQTKLDRLEIATIAFQKKIGQELLRIADGFKGEDFAREIQDRLDVALTGFLKGRRFPGGIEPGRPAQQATAEERVFAAAPDLYSGFVEGQKRLTAMSSSMQETARIMAVLDTQIQRGGKNGELAKARHAVLADQMTTMRQSAEKLKTSLGGMKEVLDQSIVIERLRVSVQDMLSGLKKFNDVVKEIDNTSIEMANREHPLAEVPAAWGDKDFWKRGMDQFELEMARIREEKGFLPFDDRQRIKWQKDEALIQHSRKKELESFNQEVSTAKSIYAELYDFQQKWGVDVKGIMSTLRSEIERAGEVTFRGGRREFRGVPSLDTMQDRLAEVAKEIRDKQYKEQHDALMLPTETLLEASNVLLGSINAQLDIIASRQPTESKALSTSDINLIIKKQFDPEGNYVGGKQTGGPISGPGGPTSDSIPAWLSDGEYVIKAASTTKMGTQMLDYINQHGEMPEFADGGKIGDVRKGKSAHGNLQKLVSKRSIRDYQKDFKRYEKEKRGFDPEQYMESFATQGMTVEDRRDLLDRISRQGGIEISGLPKVLEAARRSGFLPKPVAAAGFNLPVEGAGFATGGPVRVKEFTGSPAPTQADLKRFKEAQERVRTAQGMAPGGTQMFQEARDVPGQRLVQVKSSSIADNLTKLFGLGGGGFLTQTQKTAAWNAAEKIAEQISDKPVLTQGTWASARVQFLEQVAKALGRKHVTAKFLDSLISTWEKTDAAKEAPLGNLTTAIDKAPKTAAYVPSIGGGYVNNLIKTLSDPQRELAKTLTGKEQEDYVLRSNIAKHGFYLDENGVITNVPTATKEGFATGGAIRTSGASVPLKRFQEGSLVEKGTKAMTLVKDLMTTPPSVTIKRGLEIADVSVREFISNVKDRMSFEDAPSPDFYTEELQRRAEANRIAYEKAINEPGRLEEERQFVQELPEIDWYLSPEQFKTKYVEQGKVQYGRGDDIFGDLKRWFSGPDTEDISRSPQFQQNLADKAFTSKNKWLEILGQPKMTRDEFDAAKKLPGSRGMGMGGLLKRFQQGSPGQSDTRLVDWVKRIASGKHKLNTVPTGSYGDIFDALDSGNISDFQKFSIDPALINAVVGAYEEGTFTPEQIQAAQGLTGQSVTGLKGALGFRGGGLIKRFQAGSPGGVDDDFGLVPTVDLEDISFGPLLRALDIAALGPIVRMLLDVEPFAAETGEDITTASQGTARMALRDIGKSIDKATAGKLVGQPGAEDPFGPEVGPSKDFFEKAIPGGVEFGLQTAGIIGATKFIGSLANIGKATSAGTGSLAAEEAVYDLTGYADNYADLERQLNVLIGEGLPETFEEGIQAFKYAIKEAHGATLSGEAVEITAARKKLKDISGQILVEKLGTKTLTNAEMVDYFTKQGFSNPEHWANLLERQGTPVTQSTKLFADNVIDFVGDVESGLLPAEEVAKLSEKALPPHIQAGRVTTTQPVSNAARTAENLRLLPEELQKVLVTTPAEETTVHEILHSVFPEIRPTDTGKLQALDDLILTYTENYGEDAVASIFKKLKKGSYAGMVEELRNAELLGHLAQPALKDPKIQKVIAEGFKILPFGMGGMAKKIPSFQGGGMMPEDGLAFLHAGEEVRTPEQQRAAQTLNIDTDRIQRAVEDGITTAMSNTEVKLADTEVIAKLDTDTVKLDTTEITVNVESTATAGGAEIQAFMDNSTARMSALEGETQTFTNVIKSQSEEITALNQEIQSLDIQTSADLWDSVEDLRTDVANINADFSGRFTSYDNQITSLRRDLTENYNAHREIQSTAQQARSTATQAMSRTMNTT